MKGLLPISLPILIIAIILFSILTSRDKTIKSYKRITLFYTLISGLIFGLLFSIGFVELETSFTYAFILSGVYLLTLGIFNQVFANKLLPWYSESNFLFQFIFYIVIALFGLVLYFYGYYFLTPLEVNTFYVYNVVFFLLPFLMTKSYQYYFEIPKHDYKKWFYPFGKEINDPTDYEMESPLVIAFEFQKSFEKEEITTFRAKAPKHMKFGKLFYYFIVDYNTKHGNSKIEYIYEKSKSYGWIFYIKPTWYGRRIYIDPDITVAENLIEENSVIIAQRVLE